MGFCNAFTCDGNLINILWRDLCDTHEISTLERKSAASGASWTKKKEEGEKAAAGEKSAAHLLIQHRAARGALANVTCHITSAAPALAANGNLQAAKLVDDLLEEMADDLPTKNILILCAH